MLILFFTEFELFICKIHVKIMDSLKYMPFSRVSVLENRSSARSTCASVVRVRPRPRVAAPASSLLLRAVADAHKSLLNVSFKSLVFASLV